MLGYRAFIYLILEPEELRNDLKLDLGNCWDTRMEVRVKPSLKGSRIMGMGKIIPQPPAIKVQGP